MATPGQMAETLAQALGKPLPTVLAYDHQLAQAGYRTLGGRGRAAAKLVASDAAALLIAATACQTIKEAVSTFESFAKLKVSKGREEDLEDAATTNLGTRWELRFMKLPTIKALSDDHTFFQFFTALISAAQSEELKLGIHNEDDIRVQFHPYPSGVSAPFVKIRLHVPTTSAFVSFETLEFREWREYVGISRPSATVDLTSTFQITDRTIYAVGKRLRDEPFEVWTKRKLKHSQVS